MKDFNRRRKQAQELLAKKKKQREIIFRTRHLVVDDGERTVRVLPCGITYLTLRHRDRLPHCCKLENFGLID